MSQPKPILLVEDDERDVELTLTALEGHNLGNQVAVVRDGAEALDYLRCRGKYQARGADLPVVVLLDLKMPKVDGLEVLRQIRADEKLAFLPVVMLTSSREERDLVESYQLHANAYVVKPIDFAEFIESVGQAGVFWTLVNATPPRKR